MFQAVSSIPMDCWSAAMRSSIQSRRCSSPSPQSRHWRTHRLIRWYDPTASPSTMRFRGVGMAVLPLSKPRRRGYRRIRGNLDQAAETQVGGCPRLSVPIRGGEKSGRWVSTTFPRSGAWRPVARGRPDIDRRRGDTTSSRPRPGDPVRPWMRTLRRNNPRALA